MVDFVRDVNRARVIRVGAIFDTTQMGVCDATVPQSATCEDVLPLFATHEWVGVMDEEGTRIGGISAKQVIAALARHQQVVT